MKRYLLYTLSILLFLAMPLRAQEAPVTNPDASLAGLPIERVEVTGNQSVATDTIRVYLGLNQGDAYNPDLIRTNFHNLWQTGLFDDIRVEAEKGETGVIVKVTVSERPRIGAVEYRGNKDLTNTKINEALQRAKVEIHVGSTLEQLVLRKAAEAIQKAYEEGGHPGVNIATTLEDLPNPAEKKVVFTIDEGAKAKVARVEFTGNERFSDRRLRRSMKEVKKHNLITWIRKKDIYTPSKLEEDLERVKNLYQDYGYKDVAIGDPQISTVGRKKRVRITIPVREGEVHRFRNVSVEGNTVFTDDQIIGQWPLENGDILSRKPIRDRIDLFEELYRRRGYIYAFIDPEYESVGDNVDDVHLKVYEGDQFRLGRLEFEGNDVTKDKVLRREIYVAEGDVMDMEAFKASLYKLGQLGYFKLTDNPDFKVNPEEKTVDVTVKGKEEGKNDIQFGGGYSEAYGFFAQFQFSTRNFLGEGESLGVSFQRGARQNFFSLSYSDPWFLDKPYSFGVSIYDRQTDLPSSVGISSRGRGGSLAWGFRLGRFENLSFVYGYQRTKEHEQYQPTPDREGNIPPPLIRDTEYSTSAVVPSYRFDSRDNPYDTFRGAKASVAVSYSGGPLGGTISLIKPTASYALFHPLTRKSTVSFNIEAGQIFPQTSDCANRFTDLSKYDNILCVPRSERFFVGGEYSVRGFHSYSLGPREDIYGTGNGTLVGGYKYATLNTEYVYKINDPLRFVLFADAGQAYGYKEDWDLSKMRYSAGAELRIFLPVFQFPLRFIYAKNIDPQPNDLFDTFQFSIGNTF